MKLLLAVLAVLAVGVPAAQANPADAFGFGARAAAMAGAQTAASDDAGANYYNPAVLATFDTIRIDIGYQLADPGLEVDGQDLGVDSSRGLVLGLSAPGRIGQFPIALGGAVFLPDQHLSRTRTLAADKPRFVLYDNRPQRVFLAANLAMQVTDRVSIGGGIAYMSSTEGDVLLQGRVGFPDAEDSDLMLAIDVDLKTIRYGQAGVLVAVTPWLDVAASWRSSFVLTLDQVFDIRGDIGPRDGPVVVEDGYLALHSVAQDLFQPEQWSAGLDARLSPRLGLAFDLTWARWSGYENPAASIEFALDVGDFNDLVDIPEAPPLPDPHFSDIAVPRLGLEYAAWRCEERELALRAGYAWERSPVPEQIGETNFIDNDKHILGAGAGLTLAGVSDILLQPFTLDATVALTMLAPRVHRKLSPIDPVGDFESGGRIWQFGLSSRWRF